MAGSDSVLALGKLADVTVGQVKSWSKLGILIEATICSQQGNSVGRKELLNTKLTPYIVEAR